MKLINSFEMGGCYVEINRFEQLFNDISKFGHSKNGLNRIAYTSAEQKALSYLITLFKKSGLKVNVDAVGNVIARREGEDPSLPVVAFGSHIDSVYNGGKYDGTVGVIAAFEVIQRLNDHNIKTKHPIELIIFACEESARFGVSMIGSKAIAGILEEDQLDDLSDKNGVTIKEAFEINGFNIANLKNAKRNHDEFKVFLEMHIEQGPVLEKEEKSIGIVTAISSPTRLKINVVGEAAHSGSTPMKYRKDALLGAAEIMIALESVANSESHLGTVATIGVCDVSPSAMNVIPGSVELGVDIRGISKESIDIVVKHLLNAIKKVESERKLNVNKSMLTNEIPIQLDDEVIQSIQETCEARGLSHIKMPSGGGHDAMIMSKMCPTGLFFIPSYLGISHNKTEFTSMEQIQIGISLLEEEVLKWAIRL